MSAVRVLIDEQLWVGLAHVLRERNYDAVHTNEVGLKTTSDDLILAYATSEQRAVLTNNHRDFVPLAIAYFQRGQRHSGILLTAQLRQGELIRQIDSMFQSLTAEELENTIRWLQEFR